MALAGACLLILGSQTQCVVDDHQLSQYHFVPGSARDLTKVGTWFRDADGRYVLLRGVNLGSRSKLPPYLPIMPLAVKELDPNRFFPELNAVHPDLLRLQASGMNVVRLPVMWKGIEPEPAPDFTQLLPAGRRYLSAVKSIVDLLYQQYGMFVIIDFHQDIANDILGGDGFPDWALAIDKKHPPTPPADLTNSTWGLLYYDYQPFWYQPLDVLREAAVRNTLRSFWMNSLTNEVHDLEAFPVQTHLLKTIGLTADFFKGDPAILGYEPFNEPHPVGFPPDDFEGRMLPAFYSAALNEVDSFDHDAFLFAEPRMNWTTYAPVPEFDYFNFTLNPETFLPSSDAVGISDRAVFSFHYYDPWMLVGFPFRNSMSDKAKEWPAVFDVMQQAAASRNFIPFLSEFGCSQDWTAYTDWRPAVSHGLVVRACMELQYEQVERDLLNATYWNYDLYNSTNGGDNWNRENFSLLGPSRSPRNLDLVARCYPMRSSAEPERVFFDPETSNCAVVLRGQVVDAPTVIYVPRLMHYPGQEFEVRATSGDVAWDESKQLLYWRPDQAKAQNQIIVTPVGAFDQSVLPPESVALLPETTFETVLGADRSTPRSTPT
jgi:hypothetical protein